MATSGHAHLTYPSVPESFSKYSLMFLILIVPRPHEWHISPPLPPPDPPPPFSSFSRVHKNESIKRNVMAKRLRISALNQISLLETVYFSQNKQNMKRHGSKSWRPKCDWFCLHVALTPHYATWKCSRWIVAYWCEKTKRPSRFSNFKIGLYVRSQTGLRCSIDTLERVKQICFHVESSLIYNKARIVWRRCDTAPWKRLLHISLSDVTGII